MPTKSQIDELEKCIEVILASIRHNPSALTDLDRLRIETLLTRLLNGVISAVNQRSTKPT